MSSVSVMMGHLHTSVIFLALFGLIQHTTWGCVITCSTDYISSLTCSCTEPTPPYSYRLEAECGDEFDRVNASCEITAPKHSCTLELNSEFNIGRDTECTVRSINVDEEWNTVENNSIYLLLSDYIKPQAPYNVKLTDNDSNVSISWEMVYTEYKNYYLNNMLIYRMRIITKEDPGKEPKYYTIYEDSRYLELLYEELQPDKRYIIDIQAKPNSEFSKNGCWSDFSPTVELPKKCDTVASQDKKQCWLFFFMLLPVALCALLYYLWKNSRIPSPAGFFKPLYRTHGGDFTKWVGPTFIFGEFDFLEKNMEVVKGKQLSCLLNSEKEREDRGSWCSRGAKCMDGRFLLGVASRSSSKQNLIEGSRVSQAKEMPRGLIDTVTVMEEEGSRPAEAGEVANNPASDGTGTFSEPSALLGLFRLEWNLAASGTELEQLSLDSFSSAGHSEDGYPSVVLDLDTIDSGFLESDCGSPVQSDFSDKEQMEVAALSKPQQFCRNYVRQWVSTASAPDRQSNPAD